MAQIQVLDQSTIDKIAAGEVIERPAAAVKELVENSIDAKASAITVEIKEGGISFLRVTDNGWGIEKDQIALAFVRHSTSKIKCIEDLFTVTSLGFRGEALSSIAAVSQVELVSKTTSALSGVRYLIEGGRAQEPEEIGAPEGTTFIIRNLFFNTPARRKFLKAPGTEAGYISELIERLALSHPEISFKYIQNNQVKLHTSGNGDLREMIYHIFGRDIAANLIEVRHENDLFALTGFIGKPMISRGNRNFENYFINGRYVKSKLIASAIEDGYKSFLMQHKYPFTVLNLSMNGSALDVNVHPTKMELRFRNQEALYSSISETIQAAIKQNELIIQIEFDKRREEPISKQALLKERKKIPEPFETRRLAAMPEKKPQTMKAPANVEPPIVYQQAALPDAVVSEPAPDKPTKLLTPDSRKKHTIIGQLFETYWLVEFENNLYIIDQHAAHEKVLYERTMQAVAAKEHSSQVIFPPLLLTLNLQEEENLRQYQDYFTKIGYEITHFGGKEYSINAIPANLFGLNAEVFLVEVLDSLQKINAHSSPDMITEKIAAMSCKAAVKGNQRISRPEIEKLMDDLLTLADPYHCPHGRPTIIAMSRYELEKKFKRVL